MPADPTDAKSTENARMRLERRLFALGVPVMSAPIREAIDALIAEARFTAPPSADAMEIAEAIEFPGWLDFDLEVAREAGAPLHSWDEFYTPIARAIEAAEARGRAAGIDEAARVCDQRSQWAEDKNH